MHNFMLAENWRPVIDAMFLFTADSATYLETENADKLIDEPGRAMNPDFLDKLNRAYGEVRESYGGEFKITDINTSQKEYHPRGQRQAQVAGPVFSSCSQPGLSGGT